MTFTILLKDNLYANMERKHTKPIIHYATFFGFLCFHILLQYLPWMKITKNLKTPQKQNLM